MNHPGANGNSNPSKRTLDVLRWGISDGLNNAPLAEFADQYEAYNYELGRMAGVLLRGSGTIYDLFDAAGQAIRADLERSQRLDLCPAWADNRNPRPTHLVLADLANSLRAAGLESLQPLQEETY
jgi:hypothetical protein